MRKLTAALTAFTLLISQAAWPSVSVTVNGNSYTIPQNNEKNWGTNVTNWIQAISSNTLQPSGGAFSLLSEVDWGASFGTKGVYFKSRSTNIAGTGVLRLSNTDGIGFRNAGNSADLLLQPHADGILQYNSIDLVNLSATQTLTNKTLTAPVISTITNTGTLTLPVGPETLLGRATTDTLTNKSISGSTNTITNLSDSAIATGAAIARSKIASGTANQVVINDGSGNLSGVTPGVNGQVLTSNGTTWSSAGLPSSNYTVVTKSSAYTLTSTDQMVLASGTTTLTLPAASSNSGKVYYIEKTDAAGTNVTVARGSTDTIAGQTSTLLVGQYERIGIVSDGVSNWNYIAGGPERVLRMRMGVCTTSSCTIDNHNGVNTVTRASPGNYTVNFFSGTFSAAPTCGCAIYGNTNDACKPQALPTTSSALVYTGYTSDTAGTMTLRDGNAEVICTGLR